MQNLHDDNHLDNLSRDAAEHFELDGDLHSWQKLHPKLDTALPEKKERKRRFLIIFLMSLLVGGGLVFSGIFNNKPPIASEKNTGNAQDQKADKTNQPGDQTTTKEQSTKPGDNSTNNNTANDKSVTQEPATGSETAKTDNTTQGPVSKQQPALQDNNSRPQTNTSSISNNTTRRHTTRNNTSSVRQNQLPRNNGSIIPGDKNKNAITSQSGSNKPISNNSSISSNTSIPDATTNGKDKITEDKLLERSEPALAGSGNGIDVQSKINKPKKDQLWSTESTLSPSVVAKNNKQPRNRWEFGLTYAPDISTVKFSHTQSPGHNLGITIGYNFTKRLSLQTAFIYTTKNYKMNGSEYNPPKGYWTDYIKLETVSGECNMWDIPINLRYNIAPRKKSNFFVSSGLSSYLMQEEDYNFFYYYNGNPVNRYRSMDTTRRHWMSVLNISVGYERQIGKSFSWQVEPFFKQPLTGVGFGSMKLNSTGIYFSLKYKPHWGRTSP